MAPDSTSPSQREVDDVKRELRAAGERDFTPAWDRDHDEDAGGADRVRAAEGTGLFHGLEPGGQTGANGAKGSQGDGNGGGSHDPWLRDQLALISPETS